MTVIHYQELSTPTMMSMMMMMEATVTNGSCVVLTMTVTRWELLTLTMSSMIEETWANYCDGLSVAVDLCHRYLVVKGGRMALMTAVLDAKDASPTSVNIMMYFLRVAIRREIPI